MALVSAARSGWRMVLSAAGASPDEFCRGQRVRRLINHAIRPLVVGGEHLKDVFLYEAQ